MKKLILITGILLSTSLWASPMDDICWIDKPYTDIAIEINLEDFSYIRNECERNNILKATYISIRDSHTLISSYCRYDRNVNIFMTKDVNGADRVLLDCVLYSNYARNIGFKD